MEEERSHDHTTIPSIHWDTSWVTTPLPAHGQTLAQDKVRTRGCHTVFVQIQTTCTTMAARCKHKEESRISSSTFIHLSLTHILSLEGILSCPPSSKDGKSVVNTMTRVPRVLRRDASGATLGGMVGPPAMTAVMTEPAAG